MRPCLSRRSFLNATGVAVVASGVGLAEGCGQTAAAAPGAGARKPGGPIGLKKDHDPAELEAGAVLLPVAPARRVGVAVVGLDRLALEQILPAMAQTRSCRLVAVVSGDRAKAIAVASAHGIDERGVYSRVRSRTPPARRGCKT